MESGYGSAGRARPERMAAQTGRQPPSVFSRARGSDGLRGAARCGVFLLSFPSGNQSPAERRASWQNAQRLRQPAGLESVYESAGRARPVLPCGGESPLVSRQPLRLFRGADMAAALMKVGSLWLFPSWRSCLLMDADGRTVAPGAQEFLYSEHPGQGMPRRDRRDRLRRPCVPNPLDRLFRTTYVPPRLSFLL